MTWYRIYTEKGTTLDIWDYGHEINQIPVDQYIRMYDLNNRRGYVGGIINDDISGTAKDAKPVVYKGQEYPAKKLMLAMTHTPSAQKNIELYLKKTPINANIYMTVITDKNKGVVYQIFTGSREEAEGIKKLYSEGKIVFTKGNYVENISAIGKEQNRYKALFITLIAVILILIISYLILTVINSMLQGYYKMQEVLAYREVQKEAEQAKIESLKLHGKMLDFNGIKNEWDSGDYHFIEYANGAIVRINKNTGEVDDVRDSNVSEEWWDKFFDSLPDTNKIPGAGSAETGGFDISQYLPYILIAGAFGIFALMFIYNKEETTGLMSTVLRKVREKIE